jgi:hypothetical protein
MPKQEIGLMGYIGERVAELWIRSKFPSNQYEVVKQIMPAGIPPKGGPYLDFGVVRKGLVERIYEVKSQDYIFAGPINTALEYIWKNQDKRLQYVTLEGNKHQGSPALEACLILLVGPNQYGIEAIGRENLQKVILFQDIWGEINGRLDFNSLMENVKEDTKTVIDILQNPRVGKEITRDFLKIRNGLGVRQS